VDQVLYNSLANSGFPGLVAYINDEDYYEDWLDLDVWNLVRGQSIGMLVWLEQISFHPGNGLLHCIVDHPYLTPREQSSLLALLVDMYRHRLLMDATAPASLYVAFAPTARHYKHAISYFFDYTEPDELLMTGREATSAMVQRDVGWLVPTPSLGGPFPEFGSPDDPEWSLFNAIFDNRDNPPPFEEEDDWER
jgi:hypothetical protein